MRDLGSHHCVVWPDIKTHSSGWEAAHCERGSSDRKGSWQSGAKERHRSQ